MCQARAEEEKVRGWVGGYVGEPVDLGHLQRNIYRLTRPSLTVLR